MFNWLMAIAASFSKPEKNLVFKNNFPALVVAVSTVSDVSVDESQMVTNVCLHVCSAAEIEQLQAIAKKNDLIVIPLIQTFGHFEVCTSIDFL